MFKNSISAKPNDSSNKSEGGGDEDLSDWKAIRLKFALEHGKVRTVICNSNYVHVFEDFVADRFEIIL